MSLFSKPFWVAATERAIKSAAQAVVIALGGNVVSVWEIDLAQTSGVALAGALLSYLTSIVSSGVGAKGTPTLVVPREGDPEDADETAEVEEDDTLETATADVPEDQR